ncbi:hypothetical protein [Kribbella sp. CA-293567]|uniref:hypothetical protein n=1 Tax=Kribbella sp. CA-293567 TaxID=3002436 RepID=UPI0022DD7916|nr:hypothetical protein [Kribbella sp. CA-293567]WBQ04739.1 hypothetical protein OX958_32865 [Kribbella sp. CA-293567]
MGGQEFGDTAGDRVLIVLLVIGGLIAAAGVLFVIAMVLAGIYEYRKPLAIAGSILLTAGSLVGFIAGGGQWYVVGIFAGIALTVGAFSL